MSSLNIIKRVSWGFVVVVKSGASPPPPPPQQLFNDDISSLFPWTHPWHIDKNPQSQYTETTEHSSWVCLINHLLPQAQIQPYRYTYMSHTVEYLPPSTLPNIARDKSKLVRVRFPHLPWAESPDMPPGIEAGCRQANCRRRRVRRPGWPARAAGAAGSMRPDSWPSGGRQWRWRPAAPSGRSWHAGGNPQRHSYSAAPGGQPDDSTPFSSCTGPGRVKKSNFILLKFNGRWVLQ